MSFTRFAIFYVPPPGALFDFGTNWLGWDIRKGVAVVQPEVPGLYDATMAPRKYGFHGTLKPPFKLAAETDSNQLQNAVADLAIQTAPFQCGALRVAAMGRFLALRPHGDVEALSRLASTCVEQLDVFRAATDAAELEKRRRTKLSPVQEAMLEKWGYPYVMSEFRFHLTLTGRLAKSALGSWQEVVATHLPPLPDAFPVTSIALVGERQDGRFQVIQDYALSGCTA